MVSKRVLLFATLVALVATSAFAADPVANLEGGILNMVVDGTGNPLGKIDLTWNNAVINSVQTATSSAGPFTPVADAYATVNSYLLSGLNGGAWGGNGITSSYIPNDPNSILFQGIQTGAEWNAGHPGQNFGAAIPADTAILIKSTYKGDADFDGMVTGSDYSAIDLSWLYLDNGIPFPTPLTWAAGDFDHDGVLTGSDYALIDYAFLFVDLGMTYGPLSSQGGQSVQAVPEPSSIILVISCVLALFVWKKVK